MLWRGIEPPPYDTASINGGYQQSERKYPYLDGAGHDNVGANPIPMNFKLYFLNSLRPFMFPNHFGTWRDAVIRDGSPGDLVHPLLGKVRAVPVSWQVELAAQKTSGVIMTVSFSTTIEDPEADAAVAELVVDMQQLAAAADEDLEVLDIDYPSGERTDSLLDLMKQIESAAFSARLSIQGMANQAKGIVDGLVESVERLNDHAAWAASFNLKELGNSLEKLANQKPTPRATATIVLQHDSTLDEVAAQVGNTVGEVVTLNPKLLRAPIIRAGEAVVYFLGEGGEALFSSSNEGGKALFSG